MYSLVRNLESRNVAIREGVTFAAAFVVAEVFYKFHSFSLECLAFLATWVVLSATVDLASRLLGKGDARAEKGS
jgi:hypothetical protein